MIDSMSYKKLFLLLFCCSSYLFSVTDEFEEKLMFVVIPSYNNANIAIKNLDSVFAQEYSNYLVMYTDDCSSDGTAEIVEQYIQNHVLGYKATLIKNQFRKGALANLYHMIHAADPNAIIVTLDGDDLLAHPQVLKILNEKYWQEDVWLTYGQFELFPGGQKGWASPMPENIIAQNAFREYEHLPTHLRTFYAWLFQQIKLEDLLYLGDFYSMTWDMAMMFPMIEMAGERHHCFKDEILYLYNDDNSLSDHRISRQLQAYLAQLIRAKKRYQRLDCKPELDTESQEVADAVIFSFDAPEKLQSVIESFENTVANLKDKFIIYFASNDLNAKKYEELKNTYSQYKFYALAPRAADFRTVFIRVFEQLRANYVLFSKGDTAFTKNINVSDCIQMLQKTKAYAFYFNLSSDTINKLSSPLCSPIFVSDDMCAWNFYMARDNWSCANSLDTVLHAKDKILEGFVRAYYCPSPSGFELTWANQGALDRVGLCFDVCKTKKV